MTINGYIIKKLGREWHYSYRADHPGTGVGRKFYDLPSAVAWCEKQT